MNYYVIPDSEGNYYLGPNNNLLLDNQTVNHILDGEYTPENLIRGGLHSVPAWINFKKSKEGFVHGRFFDPKRDKYWYYARKLQNGVILVRIPREFFKSSAAKNTKPPEVNYISGYLWKTLFPVFLTKEDIIAAINEALYHIDPDESGENFKIGYALANDPFTAIKIQINLRDNKIETAYPSWGQPNTGNTGKPFTHIDAISFIMSESTEFFDEKYLIHKPPNTIFSPSIDIDIDIAKSVTPVFILKRAHNINPCRRQEVINKRNKRLRQFAKSLDSHEVKKIISYINDPVISKDPFQYLCDIYKYLHKKIKSQLVLKNIYSFYQNLYECVYVLSEVDKINQSNLVLDFIKSYLEKRFLSVGALELWENKRLHNLFIDIVLQHHNPDSLALYINNLAKSPNRISVLTDLDLNQFIRLSGPVFAINGPISITVSELHFFKYASENMGINYLTYCKEADRIKFCKYQAGKCFGGHVKQLINDSLSYEIGFDFNTFQYMFNQISTKIITKEKTPPSIDAIHNLMEDYYRCQQFQYYRIILDYKEFLSNSIDYSKQSNPKVKKQIKSKHLRWTIKHSTNNFLNDIINIARELDDDKLKQKAENKIDTITTELFPFPKQIPRHIATYNIKGEQYITFDALKRIV